jgi:hypothetical protein
MWRTASTTRVSRPCRLLMIKLPIGTQL